MTKQYSKIDKNYRSVLAHLETVFLIFLVERACTAVHYQHKQ